MNHFSAILFLYILCTLQLQPHLLIMESKPSTSTTTFTTAKQDPMPFQQSTAPGKKESNADPTSSTPNPVPTSVVPKICDRHCSHNIILTSIKEDVHGGSF